MQAEREAEIRSLEERLDEYKKERERVSQSATGRSRKL
jgi:hypothetical protein